MYRHFAVVTVCLTFALAIFADGENRSAMAEELTEQQQQAELQRQSADMVGPVTVAGKKPGPAADPGGFGDDEAMGAPSAPVGGGGGSSSGAVPDGGVYGGSMTAAQSVGFPAAQLAAMSKEERDQLVKGLKDAGVLSPEQRRRRAAALLVASRNRSGVADSSDVEGGAAE